MDDYRIATADHHKHCSALHSEIPQSSSVITLHNRNSSRTRTADPKYIASHSRRIYDSVFIIMSSPIKIPDNSLIPRTQRNTYNVTGCFELPFHLLTTHKTNAQPICNNCNCKKTAHQTSTTTLSRRNPNSESLCSEGTQTSWNETFSRFERISKTTKTLDTDDTFSSTPTTPSDYIAS